MRHDTYFEMHDMLKDIVAASPTITEPRAKERLWKKLQPDAQTYFRLLFDNWFNANWYRYEPRIENNEKDGQTVTVLRRRPAQTKQSAEQRKIVAKRTLLKISILAMPTPLGKPFGELTKSEGIALGGKTAELAKKLTNRQKFSDKFTDEYLDNWFNGSMRQAAE